MELDLTREITILLLEDNLADYELISRELTDSNLNCKITHVRNGRDFKDVLDKEHFDIILSDYQVHGLKDTEALAIAKGKYPKTPFIYISGVIDEEALVDLMKYGASDYIVKQRLHNLTTAIHKSLTEIESIRSTDVLLKSILLLEDNDADAEIIQRELTKLGLRGTVTRLKNGADYQASLEKNDYDLILSDYSIPGIDKIEAINIAKKLSPNTPFVYVSGAIQEEELVELMKFGASDYVNKNRLFKLVPAIQRATYELKLTKLYSRSKENALKHVQEAEEFAYVVSHDLKEPLRMISSYLGLLEKKYKDKLDKDGIDFIHFATDGAKRMNDLVDGLFRYSKISSRVFNYKQVDLNNLLKLVLKNLERKIIESNADIIYNDLPTILADETQLMQLFQNLIDNAIKYCQNDKPEIIIQAKEDNGGWLFSVKDNGLGIPKNMYDRVFRIFQRLHTRDEYEGLGLGLSTCKKIVDRHDGKIWVESEEGKGSTFCFTIHVNEV